MRCFRFSPWVGADYSRGGIFDRKILVLGESHYADEGSAKENLTEEVMRNYLSGGYDSEGWTNTFKKFERSLVNRETDLAERGKIWNSVVFYNYLQCVMSSPRETGGDDDFVSSAPAFFEVIQKYQPEVIIVWGQRLWNKLPYDNWHGDKDVDVNGNVIQCGHYDIGGKSYMAFPVNHPSGGYPWDYWHTVISAFL